MVQLLRERLARPASTDGASTEAAYISQSYDTDDRHSSPASERATRAHQGEEEEDAEETRRSPCLGKEVDNFQKDIPLAGDVPERDSKDESISGSEAVLLTAASPPSNRQRLSCVAVQGRRDAAALNGALINRGALVPEASYFYESSRFPTEPEAEFRRNSFEAEREITEENRPRSARRKFTILHYFAMVLTFMAMVSLWGILDTAVEVAAGVSSKSQLQLYAVLLLVGILTALALRKLKELAYKGTFYPALLASLLTAAAGWGLVDVAVEAASGEDKVKRLLYYFIAFFGTGFFVALHVVLVDRGFSEMFERFI